MKPTKLKKQLHSKVKIAHLNANLGLYFIILFFL